MVSGERLKTALVGASIALILIASALTDRTISALIAAQDWVDHTQSVIDHIDPTLTAMTESAFNGSKMRRIGAFTGREGRITLRARLTPSGEIAISVSDNGIGMSPEVMANAAQGLLPGGSNRGAGARWHRPRSFHRTGIDEAPRRIARAREHDRRRHDRDVDVPSRASSAWRTGPTGSRSPEGRRADDGASSLCCWLALDGVRGQRAKDAGLLS
jgi:hypothetical protein